MNRPETLSARVAQLAMLAVDQHDGPAQQQAFAAMVAFAEPCRAAAPYAPLAPDAPCAQALRADEAGESLPLDSVLQNAATTERPYLTVPRTVE